MRGIIISVVNNKGGVGKTTLSCNLGAALSRLKQTVLVVDLDSQCNTTGILLNGDMAVRNSLYELLDPSDDDEGVSVEQCVYLSCTKGLYCLPNVEETSGLEMDLITYFPQSLKFLRDKIRDYAKEHFDFTIIDNPPNMGTFVANSLYASDLVVVPIDASSSYSIDGLRKALELIASVQKSGNPNLKFLRLLLNRVDLRKGISRMILHDIKQRFSEDDVFETTIPVNNMFQEAEYVKKTIFDYYPTSRAAQSYRKFAQEMLALCGHEFHRQEEP